jgi:hypothetical protein
MFTAIFLALFVTGWLVCAYLPWATWSIATRGAAGVQFLPFCLFAGVLAAVAVPVLGADGMAGLWLSFPLAAIASLGALAAAHLGRIGRAQVPPAEDRRGGGRV